MSDVAVPNKENVYFVFANDFLVVRTQQISTLNPLPRIDELQAISLPLDNAYCFAETDTTRYYTCAVAPDHAFSPALKAENLRNIFQHFDDFHLDLAMKAKQYNHWFKTHRFCSQCGSSIRLKHHESAFHCAVCKLDFFPKISPCVIMLITRGDEVLLARSPHFQPGVYSLLAGFVEVGETIEAAVHREVFEEVGVRIKNLRYQFSQPWPFPHSLMLGFIADYESGEIKIDYNELEDAQWYSIHALPKKPFILSIARKILDGYIESRQIARSSSNLSEH